MKKIIYRILVTLVCAVACNRNEAESDLLRSKEFICHMEDEEIPEVRTSLGPDNSVTWDKDDYIKVFSANDTDGSIFTDISLENEGRRAVFKGVTEIADSYFAVYPADAGSAFDAQKSTMKVRIPSEQKARAGSFADNTNPAIAKTEDKDLYFRNIGALLAIKCPTDRKSVV